MIFRKHSDQGLILNENYSSMDYYITSPLHGFQYAQCYPLYSFLLALGRTTVDYLSLDVESSEYKVLQTLPWDKVDIKVREAVGHKQLFSINMKYEVTDQNYTWTKRELRSVN